MAIPSTLLQLTQRACDELSLPRSSIVAASTDDMMRTLFALFNAEGAYLMRNYPWSFLQTVGTITTVDGTSDYALATDFDRLIPETIWDRTNQRRVYGPEIPAVNRARMESITQVGIQKFARQVGSSLRITPTPDSVTTIAYEYISNKWARKADSTAQTEFLIDSDTSVFNPYLLIAGVKWRFRAAKGLDAVAAKLEYDQLFEELTRNDNGGEVINMGRVPGGDQFVSLANVPDTGVGQ